MTCRDCTSPRGDETGFCEGCREHRADGHMPRWDEDFRAWCHFEEGAVRLGEMNERAKRAWRTLRRRFQGQVYTHRKGWA